MHPPWLGGAPGPQWATAAAAVGSGAVRRGSWLRGRERAWGGVVRGRIDKVRIYIGWGTHTNTRRSPQIIDPQPIQKHRIAFNTLKY